MSFDLDRYDDGYLLTLWPPLAESKREERGLHAVDIRTKLRGLSVHPRDIEDAISGADARFERGTTDRSRAVVAIWRRAANGVATSEDVEVLREELRADTLGGRKTYLINALYMAGQRAEAVELLLRLLDVCEKEDDVELGLRFLSEWSPEAFERAAVRFIRGVPWDRRFVQAWAMLYAGVLLERGLALTLLDELAGIALDARATEVARHQARVGLANAAGLKMMSPQHNHFIDHASDSEVRQLIEAVRARLSEDA
jgi:hypothetical protein